MDKALLAFYQLTETPDWNSIVTACESNQSVVLIGTRGGEDSVVTHTFWPLSIKEIVTGTKNYAGRSDFISKEYCAVGTIVIDDETFLAEGPIILSNRHPGWLRIISPQVISEQSA